MFKTRMTSLGAPPPASDAQIGIGPPDDAWQSGLSVISPRRALNIFLAELRENRSLRSSEPAPVRVDCHYLITAWTPSSDRATKTLDEHQVLADALAVLVEAQVVTVGETELPTQIVPPEGFAKLAEFWGTMGAKHRWKPAILLVVTIPVRRPSPPSGPPVTTRFSDYVQHGLPDSAEHRMQIGGHVRDSLGAPVARAWIQLEDAAMVPLQATRSNANGEFDFVRVQPGSYRLRARSDAHVEVLSGPLTVPSPNGLYDLAFS